MLDSKGLLTMSQVEIDRVDRSKLVDVHTIVVSDELSHREKVMSVMEQLGNPYCFLSGDTPVRMRFVNEEKTLSALIVAYFSKLKQR